MLKNKEQKSIDILLLSDNGLETVGGEQESTKIIINGIKNDYNLGVIQPGEVINKIRNVKYYNMTKRTRIKHLIKNPFAFISYINKIRKIIRQDAPKIIHTQAQVSFFIISLLFKLKLIPQTIKFIHTERGLYTKYNTFFKALFVFFMKELNVLVTTTEFNMGYWKKALHNKCYPDRFKIIENTAGELFETYDSSKERENDGKFVIGFAGRYADWKNWPLAVEISEKLKEKLKDDLVVKMAVGCLDEKSLKETKKMFQYMSGLLGNNFEGQINMTLEEMDQFYYELDVFILTSNYNTESFGRTLVEAMSRKVAVLSTDAGGPVEVVKNKENILNNAEEFVTKIIELDVDDQLLQNEKEKNLEIVKANYSLFNNIKEHDALYDGLIKKINERINVNGRI